MRQVLRRFKILEEDQRFMRRFLTLGSVVRASVSWAIGLACALVFVDLSAAQLPAPNPKLKGSQTGVATDLRDKSFAALPMEEFDAYFNEYLLLMLADPDAKPPMDLPAMRHALHTRYFGQGKDGPPYERLVRLTFDMMKKIIKEKFPDEPKYDAVKMNAMLVIGELNEQEGGVGGKPKPYAAAMQYMLGVVNNPKEPDFLRVPALLGIKIHCDCFDAYPPGADARKEIASSMLKILKEKTPPENRSPSAQAWLQRMALQNLAALGSPGAASPTDVVDAVVALVRDEENPMSLRCAAASSFGDLKLAGVNGINANDLSNQLGALAVALEKRESDLSQETEDGPNLRRLKLGLRDVYYGLVGRDGHHGLSLAAPEPRRPAIEEMAKKIKEVLLAANLSTEDLEKKRLDLEKLLKTAKPAAPALVAPPSDPKGAAPKTGSRKATPPPDTGPLAGAPATP